MTTLYFSRPAWTKLMWFRDKGPTEVFGFGIIPDKDPKSVPYVTDIVFPPQEATSARADLDDDGFAAYVEKMVALGYDPWQVTRISVHTHPGGGPGSANPSGTDREMVNKIFSGYNWGVMVILSRGGEIYSELVLKSPFGDTVSSPVEVKVWDPHSTEDENLWTAEYKENVRPPKPQEVDRDVYGRFCGGTQPRFSSYRDSFWDDVHRTDSVHDAAEQRQGAGGFLRYDQKVFRLAGQLAMVSGDGADFDKLPKKRRKQLLRQAQEMLAGETISLEGVETIGDHHDARQLGTELAAGNILSCGQS